MVNIRDKQKLSPSNEVPPERGFLNSFRHYFREYCQSTSVHGFRYFGEKRTIFERIWWFLIFVFCVIACVYSIHTVYRKWDNNPVIVTFATKGTPIYSIPFPAVTVCPESKSAQWLFNFTEILQRKQGNDTLHPVEARMFEYMSLVCDQYRELVEYMNNDTFSEEFFQIVDFVKPQFMILECNYMGKKEECEDIFVPILTDEGVCYTFNMMDRDAIYRKDVLHYGNYHEVKTNSSMWSVEHGYSPEAGTDVYPRRALLAGAKNALKFSIMTPKDILDYACKNSLQGYRVVLHMPMRVPRPSQQYFRVPLNQEIVAAIHPNMITTSDSVKIYNPRRRECYFPSERHLQFFKIYSQMNCEMECLTNYTLDYCGCVNFFMPRENGTQICGTGNTDCMKEAEMDLQMKDLNSKLSKPTRSLRTLFLKVRNKHCDCLPICTDITYDLETSQTDWDWFKQYKAQIVAKPDDEMDNFLKPDLFHMSSLEIFFKSNHFIPSERNELYGPTDFLANFGGLLGLFMGFSVLSLMEILYFLTVRLICNIKLYGYWAGPDTK